MDSNTVISNYKNIISLLDMKKLSKSITYLKTFSEDAISEDISRNLSELETNYLTMLDYLNNGIIDPEREKVHSNLLNKAYDLAERIRINLLVYHSDNFYFESKRRFYFDPSHSFNSMFEILKQSYSKIGNNNGKTYDYTLEDCQQHEETLNNLFNSVWLNDFWKTEDYENINSLFSDDNILLMDKASVIGAILLSLFEHFDEKKMLFLFDAYNSKEVLLSQWAIVSIALVISNFPQKILQHSEIYSRLKLFKDDPAFVNNMIMIQKLLIQTWETEKITKKMKEDIIPTITRFAERSNIPDSTEIINPLAMDDINPEWSNWMEKSGINDKLREIGDLQQEGADVYMITFSQLKTYPFFAKLSNWFIPYTNAHSHIMLSFNNNEELKKDKVVNLILNSNLFCDSDKYSFSFLLSHLPDNQRNAIFPQLKEDEEKEQMENDKVDDAEKLKQIYSRSFIRDLYRFYHLFYRRKDFVNPFNKIELYKTKPLEDLFTSKNSILMSISDYLIRHEYYDRAIYPLSVLDGRDKEDALEILQKLGLCNQKMLDLNHGIKYFIRALNIDPNNIWTNRHLGDLYSTSMLFKEAIPYYKKVEQAKPNSISLIRELADCLMHTGEREKALNYYFKVEYIENDKVSIHTLRDITETLLICGKIEQAQTYINKILDKDKSYKSFLLAGHVYWFKGNLKRAFMYYHQAKITYNDTTNFDDAFYRSTIPYILSDTMSEDDVSLMRDVVNTI